MKRGIHAQAERHRVVPGGWAVEIGDWRNQQSRARDGMAEPTWEAQLRYIVVFLLLLNIAYFGWSLLRSPELPAAPAPRPLRNEGLQLVREAREVELARLGAEAEQVCLFVHGFADIFEASEFAAASISDNIEATVYIAQPGDIAEVRLRRHVEDPEDIPQWPDFADQSPELTGAENACQTFAHADHFH